MADLATPTRSSVSRPHHPGDSDPNPDEALRRVRATRPGGAR